MPLLTIVNLSTSDTAFQDPTGVTGMVIHVGASATVTDKVVTLNELQSIEAQLVTEATASRISWTVKDDPDSVSDSLVPAARLFLFSAPAAKGTTEVRALHDVATTDAITAGITNPGVPRNLRVTKAASWDGGTITVVGTDQFDAAITEVFPALVAGLEVGTKIFKTVTSFARSIALAGGTGVSIGCGDLIGIPVRVDSAYGMLSLAGVSEAVTVSTTVHSFTPTSLPDGVSNYILLVNC